MGFIIRWSVAASLVLSASTLASTYDDLALAFKAGTPVTNKDVQGYWSGRCVRAEMPDAVHPGVLVHRIVRDDSAFPPTRPSFTYYFDVQLKGAYFDAMLPHQIEATPALRAWFKKEQWKGTVSEEGSLVNYYDQAPGKSVRRALRKYDGQFESMLVLEVSSVNTVDDDATTTTNRYCYFNKFLGKTHPGTEDPGPVTAGAKFGDIINVNGGYVSATNQNEKSAIVWVAFENVGFQPVVLQDASITLTNGSLVREPRAVRIEPRGRFMVGVTGVTWFHVRAARAHVTGPGSLRIVGMVR